MIDIKNNKGYLESSILLNNNTPFIILKPNMCSYDETIPYLAMTLGYELIKVGIHDIGCYVKHTDALSLIKESLLLKITGKTILWVEDISPVDDKALFIKRTLEMVNGGNVFIIFTGVVDMCKELYGILPIIEWDENIPSIKQFLWKYITPSGCSTKIVAPQTLHFRVYSNIISELTREFGNIPDISIITENGNGRLDSIISSIKLCIKRGDTIQISTSCRPVKHESVIECILRGWSEPVGFIYEWYKKIS